MADEKKEKVFVEETQKKHNFPFGGLVLILLGIIFLLNNFGFLPWNIWSFLWRLWPLFLISWGVDALLGKSGLGHLVGIIIFAALLILILLFATQPNLPIFQSLNKSENFWRAFGQQFEDHDGKQFRFESDWQFD